MTSRRADGRFPPRTRPSRARSFTRSTTTTTTRVSRSSRPPSGSRSTSTWRGRSWQDYCDIPGYTNLALVEQHLAPTDYGVVKEDQRIFELNPSDKIVNLDYDSTVNAFIETTSQTVVTRARFPSSMT